MLLLSFQPLVCLTAGVVASEIFRHVCRVLIDLPDVTLAMGLRYRQTNFTALSRKRSIERGLSKASGTIYVRRGRIVRFANPVASANLGGRCVYGDIERSRTGTVCS